MPPNQFAHQALKSSIQFERWQAVFDGLSSPSSCPDSADVAHRIAGRNGALNEPSETLKDEHSAGSKGDPSHDNATYYLYTELLQ